MNWDIWKTFVKLDFLVRYQHSVLGFVWVFLKPFLLFSVLLVVFSIFRQDIPYFSLSLLLGIILFQFFSDATLFGMRSILERGYLRLQLPFSSEISVFAALTSAVIHLFFALGLFILFFLFRGPILTFGGSIIFIFLLICEGLLVGGISFFFSLFVLRFRDLGEIWEVCLAALFYLVPIFYPWDIVPESLRAILWWNPLTQIIQFSRNAILLQKLPEWHQLAVLFAICGGLFLLGIFFFRRRERMFCEQL